MRVFIILMMMIMMMMSMKMSSYDIQLLVTHYDLVICSVQLPSALVPPFISLVASSLYSLFLVYVSFTIIYSDLICLFDFNLDLTLTSPIIIQSFVSSGCVFFFNGPLL